MSEHAKAKVKRFTEILDEIAVVTMDIEAEEGKNDTPENREKLSALLLKGEDLRKSIEQDQKILGLKSFMTEPAHESRAYPGGHDGVISQPYGGGVIKSLGEQFIESENYKAITAGLKAGDKLSAGQANLRFEAKGFLGGPSQSKATFTSTSTGADTTINYIARPIVLVEQQRLMVRDLMPVGETTMSSVPYLAEVSFTNAADMVAEEGEKPEATLVTEDRTAPIKKIAVVLKVTDEMWSDFPVLRDYVNGRLRFMVEAKEEQQLVNGTGVGNQITGLLQTSGIQTTSATTPGEIDAIMKAKTKIRTGGANIGGYEPNGIIINPNDWEGIRLMKDGVNGQYYGGGPFTGAFGQPGQFQEEPKIWGLRPIVTTAITAGTALVGDFRQAQIWQREGVSVDSTNSNEDDFNFNRVSLRVEERLGLAVYAPLAFCKVTDIAF